MGAARPAAGVVFALFLIVCFALGAIIVCMAIGMLTFALLGWIAAGVACIFWYALCVALSRVGWFDGYQKFFDLNI